MRIALEIEVSEFIKQFDGQRGMSGGAAVVRSGYQPERQVCTGIGPLTIKVPKVRSTTGEPVSFRSLLVPPYIRKTRSLEASVSWLYLKGVSTGDMQEALKLLLGELADGFSPSTVSRLKTEWEAELAAFRERDLSGERIVYMYADGIYSGLRSSTTKLCTLVIIGVTDTGRKVLLAIEDGERESKLSWTEVLVDLKQRGLSAPKLAVGDGAMGFWAALDEVYPTTLHQRCWQHKTVNVLNRLPKSMHEAAGSDLYEIRMAPTRVQASKAFDWFLTRCEAKYPKAAETLSKDREELLAFCDFPGPALEESAHDQSDRIDVCDGAPAHPADPGLSESQRPAGDDVQAGAMRRGNMALDGRLQKPGQGD